MLKDVKGKRPEQHAMIVSLARRVLISAGLGFAVLVALLCIAATISLRIDLASAHMGLIAIALAGLAAFVAGYANVRPVRQRGLVFGLFAAAVFYVPVLLSALVISRVMPGTNAVILLLVMLAAGAVGGVVAANRTAAKKPGKKRKRA